MTLTMMETGSHEYIKRITGKDDVKRFLASLGFVEGEGVTVISRVGGNLILSIKDCFGQHHGKPHYCINSLQAS